MARQRLRNWLQRVYMYAAEPKGDLPQELWDIAHKMKDLWNDLVTLHKQTMEESSKLIAEDSGENQAWTMIQQILNLPGASKDVKQSLKKASMLTDRIRLNAAFSALMEANQLPAQKQEYQKLLETLHQHYLVRLELTRKRKDVWRNFDTKCQEVVKRSGLNWELGPEVLKRFQTTIRIATSRRRKDGTPGWPRYRSGLERINIVHRFTTGGLPIEKLFAPKVNPKRRIQIKQKPSEAWIRSDATHKKMRATDGVFRLDNSTIQFKVILHRQMPEGAILKRASWIGRRQGLLGWKWYLSFTCEIPPESTAIVSKSSIIQTVAALNFGWRRIGNYLRVVTIGTASGQFLELKLPLDFHTKENQKVNEHLGFVAIPENYMDWLNLDESIGSGVQSIKSQIIDEIGSAALPEQLAWIKDKQIWDSTRQKRLLFLLKQLQDLSIYPDLIEKLSRWREHDAQFSLKKLKLLNRLDGRKSWIYRNAAAWIARTFEIVMIPKDMDLQFLAAQASESYAIAASQRYRQWASPSMLRETIIRSCEKFGATILERRITNATWACHRCGEMVQPTAKLQAECPNGHRWDVDVNATKNYLKESDTIHGRHLLIPKEISRFLVELTPHEI